MLYGDRAVDTVTSGTFLLTLQGQPGHGSLQTVILSGRHSSYAGCPRPPLAGGSRGAPVLPFLRNSEVARGNHL